MGIKVLHRAGAWLAACICCSTMAAQADIFYLTSGGRVEGELLNPNESPRQTYWLQTSHRGRVRLTRPQVERVEARSEAEKRYDAFVATMADTIESHLDVANRCEKAGLKAQREYHLEQVLRLDPNHEATRRELGYNLVDGVWLRPDDFMRNQGYVRHGGAWRLPQEVTLLEAAEAQEAKIVEWRKNIKRWRDWFIKGGDRAAEGRAEIVQIRDPLATTALVECLTRDKDPPAARLLYIEALGEIGGPGAVATFVRLALEDPNPNIQEACLDRLAKSGSKAAVRQFVQALDHNENAIVGRAGVALERMKDPEATLPLIEALHTEHKVVIGGSQMNPTFSGDGGAGLSMGGGQKVLTVPFNNQSVLRALLTLHLGVNFGFDEKRWKAWYIDQHRPKTLVNLRRAP
ncbi:MAG: HEAT repeat domain-containing protein [Pirellulaceae bacterium]